MYLQPFDWTNVSQILKHLTGRKPPRKHIWNSSFVLWMVVLADFIVLASVFRSFLVLFWTPSTQLGNLTWLHISGWHFAHAQSMLIALNHHRKQKKKKTISNWYFSVVRALDECVYCCMEIQFVRVILWDGCCVDVWETTSDTHKNNNNNNGHHAETMKRILII